MCRRRAFTRQVTASPGGRCRPVTPRTGGTLRAGPRPGGRAAGSSARSVRCLSLGRGSPGAAAPGGSEPRLPAASARARLVANFASRRSPGLLAGGATRPSGRGGPRRRRGGARPAPGAPPSRPGRRAPPRPTAPRPGPARTARRQPRDISPSPPPPPPAPPGPGGAAQAAAMATGAAPAAAAGGGPAPLPPPGRTCSGGRRTPRHAGRGLRRRGWGVPRKKKKIKKKIKTWRSAHGPPDGQGEKRALPSPPAAGSRAPCPQRSARL